MGKKLSSATAEAVYYTHLGMKLLKKAKEYGVAELTYYGFTTDNCKRPKEQFEAFQSACVEAVQMQMCIRDRISC